MADALYQKGVSAFKAGNHVLALEAMKQVRQVHPDDPDALYFQAVCLLRLEQGDVAAPLLRRLTEIKSNDFYLLQGHLLLAWHHASKGRFEPAEDELHALLKKNYENPQVYSILGYIYFMRHDYPQAEYYYQKALALDKNNPNAHNGLGSTYLEWVEKRELALPHLEKALSERPGYFAYLDSIGWMHYLKQNLGRALFYLNKALRTRRHPIIQQHVNEAHKAEQNGFPALTPGPTRKS
jgi:tetratricopeptide (TPR) repeat protein